jgi:hypothetical protein
MSESWLATELLATKSEDENKDKAFNKEGI